MTTGLLVGTPVWRSLSRACRGFSGGQNATARTVPDHPIPIRSLPGDRTIERRRAMWTRNVRNLVGALSVAASVGSLLAGCGGSSSNAVVPPGLTKTYKQTNLAPGKQQQNAPSASIYLYRTRPQPMREYAVAYQAHTHDQVAT